MVKKNRLNSILFLGLFATAGILVAQLLWTRQAYTIEEKKFNQKVHIALLEVVKKLYEGTNRELPGENPVHKIANDYYVVNVDNDFDPEILEFYLKAEFARSGITTDFEYAVYNCQSDEMVYGKYVSVTQGRKNSRVYFPKHKNLIYYFAIRFPNETTYLFTSLKFWFGLSFALVIILLVYVYSIRTLLQQKKYSELQRDFINNMTHEFKTPLASILLASNYINRQEAIKGDPKLSKYAEIIIGQSSKLNEHIEKILTIAKSDESPLQLNPTRLSLLPLLQEAAENIRLKHEEVDIRVESGRDYRIKADEFHLTNVVYNLLDNSIKYCEHPPVIVVSLSEHKGVLQLRVTDNGIGIPEKKLAHIFDKFYRVPNVKSNETNGFGLGLYYVRKICDLHRWKIKAENLPEGLALTISIPDYESS